MKIKFLLSRDRARPLSSTARMGAILKNGFTIAQQILRSATFRPRAPRLISHSQIEGCVARDKRQGTVEIAFFFLMTKEKITRTRRDMSYRASKFER